MLACSLSQLLLRVSAATRHDAILVVMDCASSRKQALLLGMLTHKKCVRSDQALCCADDVEIIKHAHSKEMSYQ